MNAYDEAKRLRVRESVLTEISTRGPSDQTSGPPCMVARTVSLGSYPTTATCFYACNPITVLGTEAEDGPSILTTEACTLFALNLGSTIPPAGTDILVTFVRHRWAFRYDG
jgi:hypothetical protein